jgi:predicted Rossmann fold flavoprotein
LDIEKLKISLHANDFRETSPTNHFHKIQLSHLKQNAKSSCSLYDADEWLLEAKAQTVLSRLREKLPERLAKTLLESAGIASDRTAKQIDRDRRRSLAQLLCGAPVEIVGDRGFTHAEVTAGGVPLVELNLSTMESRKCPGLFLAGEVLDVDGRIGGFNFQWAWASGFVAGVSMATSLIS